METRLKILKHCKEPISIKDLKLRVGFTWSNISKQVRKLENEGLLRQVGYVKKSRIMQVNKQKAMEFVQKELIEIEKIALELVGENKDGI